MRARALEPGHEADIILEINSHCSPSLYQGMYQSMKKIMLKSTV